MKSRTRKKAAYNDQIPAQYLDDLTGLYNRRYLFSFAPDLIMKENAQKRPLTVVVIDIDHFKGVNDVFGHSHGDRVLHAFGVYLKKTLRENDYIFRFGGDEFVCLLTNTEYNQAKKISLRLIEQCRNLEFADVRFTLSIGIASCPSHARTWQELFDIADKNLYNAKRKGRNRIGRIEGEERELKIPVGELIGRDDEKYTLIEAMNDLFNGKGGAACIHGEAGVGKTSLVHAVISNSHYRGFTFLESNLSTTTKSIPYFPFREIIRSLVSEQGHAIIKKLPHAYQIELTKILPELDEIVHNGEHGTRMVDQYRLFEGVRRFLEQYASTNQCFFFLDNIHWIDRGSLDLLHYLVRTLREKPVFFLFVYRSEEEKNEVLLSTLQLMGREALYKKIVLNPLPEADIKRMVSLIMGTDPPHALSEYIVVQSGGNPFFVEELLKTLRSNNVLAYKGNEWVYKQNHDVVIPYSIEGIIERKLSIISDDARAILDFASVIGNTFEFSLLRDVSKKNEGYLFDLIDEILKVGLLKQGDSDTYCFSEDIIRRVIYRKIHRSRLKHYHRLVAKQLLALYKNNITECVEELAAHFYLSGDFKEAVVFTVQSGDRAKDSYANHDAIRFYTWSLECLKRLTGKPNRIQQTEVLKKRAEVYHIQGENDKAKSDLENAIHQANTTGNVEMEAECMLQISALLKETAHYLEAQTYAEIAFRNYQTTANKKGEADALHSIAVTYASLDDYQKALEYYQSSLDIYENLGDHGGEALSYNAIGGLWVAQEKLELALETYNHALHICKSMKISVIRARILNNIGSVNAMIGNSNEALKYFQESLKIAEKIGHRRSESICLSNLGNIFQERGDYRQSLDFHNRSLTIDKEIGDRHHIAMNLYNLSNTYSYLDDTKKAEAALRDAYEIRNEIGDRVGQAQCLIAMSDILEETTSAVELEKSLRKAYRIAREIGSDRVLTDALRHFGTLYIGTGDLKKAEKYLSRALSLARKHESGIMQAHVENALARVYSMQGKCTKADALFQTSLSFYAEKGDRYSIALTYFYLGKAYVRSGNTRQAKKLFSKARTVFNELDLQGWVKRIANEKKTGRNRRKPRQERSKTIPQS